MADGEHLKKHHTHNKQELDLGKRNTMPSMNWSFASYRNNESCGLQRNPTKNAKKEEIPLTKSRCGLWLGDVEGKEGLAT